MISRLFWALLVKTMPHKQQSFPIAPGIKSLRSIMSIKHRGLAFTPS